MENAKSTNWYMLLIKGIIMILLSILVFASPADALLTYVLYIGIGLIVTGIVSIVQGFQAKGLDDQWGWTVLGGVLDIVLGFILIANPVLTAAILPFVFGFWAVFFGFSLFISAFAGTGGGVLKFLAGILTVIVGFGIMFNPVLGGLTLAVWVGVILLIVGIYSVIASFSLR